MEFKKNFQILSIIVATLVFSGNANAGGFGVSPPQIIADNLLKGSVYEQIITLVQSEPDEDLQAEVVFDAPEIESWISIDQGMSFIIPKGGQQFPIKIKISVPEDALMGKYKGFIRVNTSPAKIKEVKEGSNVSINYGGRIDLDLTVGNNVIEEFEVLAITMKNIETGWSLLAFVKIQNTGNVPVKLDRATFDLFDKYNAVRLGYAQTEEFESVSPYSAKETMMQFPIDLRLGLGEYSGTVKVYKDGKVVKELQTPFRVVEAGTLDYSPEGIIKDDNKKIDFDKNLLIALLALILVMVVAVVIIIKKKNKKRSAKNEKEEEEVKENNAKDKEEKGGE
ncbi:MAG: hypothetical protein P1P85_01090 [Patescibacteria group bacterium]|nr:hypothetical protein [Patescibacteria group bacterium]